MENHFKGSRHGCLFDDCNIGGSMAYLFRLIALLFAIWVSPSSYASFSPAVNPPSNCTFFGSNCYSFYARSGSSKEWPTALEACKNNYWSNASYTPGATPTSDGTCVTSGGPFIVSAGVRSPIYLCPANSSGASSCTCNSGYQENAAHTSCVSQASANCAAVSGQIAGSVNSPYTP